MPVPFTENLLKKYQKERMMVIAIDPSIRNMGYARFCSGILDSNEEQNLPFIDTLDPAYRLRCDRMAPLVLGTFSNAQKGIDIDIERGLSQVNKIRIFIEDQLVRMKSFVEGEIQDFAKSQRTMASSKHQRDRYTNYIDPERIFVVIEVPLRFYTGAAKKHAERGALQAYLIGLLLGAFPDAILRKVEPGTTLKKGAKSILIVRDYDMKWFWEQATDDEIDAYMALEWFLYNKYEEMIHGKE